MTDKHLTITNVQDVGDVRATFKDAAVEPQFFPWTFTAEAGGSISPAGLQQVAQGTDLFVTLTPDNGKELYQVFLNGTAIATDD